MKIEQQPHYHKSSKVNYCQHPDFLVKNIFNLEKIHVFLLSQFLNKLFNLKCICPTTFNKYVLIPLDVQGTGEGTKLNMTSFHSESSPVRGRESTNHGNHSPPALGALADSRTSKQEVKTLDSNPSPAPPANHPTMP